MFLPLGDEPNPPIRPWVNWTLIAANVITFLLTAAPMMSQAANPSDPLFGEYLRFLQRHVPDATPAALAGQISAYDLFVFHWGYRPASPSLLTVFTSMFMHGGWAHLFGNMLFLYIFGDNVEYRLGRVGYLVTYLACGAAATFFFALFAGDSNTPLVGASGAISGVLGLYFVWFPKNVVRTIFFFQLVHVPARLVLGAYLIIDNVLPFISGRSAGGVAHGAHIGGFVAGFLLAWGLAKGGEKSAPLSRFVPNRQPFGGRAIVPSFEPARDFSVNAPQVFRQSLAAGNWHDVYRAYVAMSQNERDQIDKADAIRFADWLTDHGDYDVALALLRRFIEVQRDAQWLARAHLRAGLIDLHFKNDSAEASSHFYKVLELGASNDMQQVARNALAQARSTRFDLN